MLDTNRGECGVIANSERVIHPASMTGWLILKSFVSGVEKTGFEEGMLSQMQVGVSTTFCWCVSLYLRRRSSGPATAPTSAGGGSVSLPNPAHAIGEVENKTSALTN